MTIRMTDRTTTRMRLVVVIAAAGLALTACGSTGTAGSVGSVGSVGSAAGGDRGSTSAVGASPSGGSSSAAVGASSGGASSSAPASSSPSNSATASGVPSSGSPSSGVPSSGSPSSGVSAGTSAVPATSVSSTPSTRISSASGGAVAPDGVRGHQFSARAATGRDLAPGKAIAVSFPAANGTVSINAGCNVTGGTATWTASKLTVTPGISTSMACIDPGGGNQRMVQEHWFSQWLSKGVDWKLTGAELVLSADGVTISFVRAGIPESHPAAPSAHPPLVNTDPTSTTDAARPTQAQPGPRVGPTSLSPGLATTAMTQRPGDSLNPPPTTDH